MSSGADHLTDELLVEHYYRTGTPDAATELHLGSCDTCRVRLQHLQRLLNGIDGWTVPEPADGWELQVWQKLRPRLSELPRQRSGWGWREWAAVAASVALLAVAFTFGRLTSPEPQQPVAVREPAQVRERILLVALSDHLERSRMVLVELANSEPGGRLRIDAQREQAEDLVEANRLYRQAAAKTGSPGLAETLDELERVLLEVAHSPNELNERRLEGLRERIQEEGLLFKVRVLDDTLRRQSDRPARTGSGWGSEERR